MHEISLLLEFNEYDSHRLGYTWYPGAEMHTHTLTHTHTHTNSGDTHYTNAAHSATHLYVDMNHFMQLG